MGDPSVHDYLTTAGMETVARAAPLGEGSILELPLLLLRGVVLFPGESLPLRLHSLDNIRLVLTLASQQQRARARAASGGHHLGVLNTRRPSHLGPGQHPALLQLCESVGTTAELEEVETADNWSVEEGMAAKARGRHRFRIIPPGQPGHGLTTRQGVLHAHVQILAEDRLPPLSHAYPLPRPIWARLADSDAACTTYWPPSVWRQFDPHLLMARAQAVLRSVAAWEGVKGATGLDLVQLAQEEQEQPPSSLPSTMTADPVAFSFRLAANLPLDDELRQRLLAADTLVDRCVLGSDSSPFDFTRSYIPSSRSRHTISLRLLLALLKESATRRLCCARCRRPLAAKPAVFSVPGAEGTVGAYVNAHGFVHQTLTLRELLRPERVLLEGEPESQDSWFPGYAWQIAYCARCGLHLGWRFTPVAAAPQAQTSSEAAPDEADAAGAGAGASRRRARSQSQERPPFFWGLRRAALVDESADMSAAAEEGDEDDDGQPDPWVLAAVGAAGAQLGSDDDSEGDDDDEDEEEDEEGLEFEVMEEGSSGSGSDETASESSEDDGDGA